MFVLNNNKSIVFKLEYFINPRNIDIRKLGPLEYV